MLPDRVSNPGPLTYESGALPIALRSPVKSLCCDFDECNYSNMYLCDKSFILYFNFFGGTKSQKV